MMRTLVIGYGNTLRSDDGAGIRAAELVAARLPDVDCLCVQELQPELAETISLYDRVFFLDASLKSQRLRLSTLGPASTVPDGTHTLSPATLLSLSQTLYRRLPQTATMIEIPAMTCDFGEQLSTETEGFVNACVEKVQHSLTTLQ